MRIRMLESCRETEDGFAIRHFAAGEEYDMGEILACRLLRWGRAHVVESESAMVKEEG